MILTVREILIAVDSGALKRLAQQPIPAVGAWRLRRILRLLEAEYGAASAARIGLMTEENSMPVNGGAARMVKPEFAAAFEADPVFAQTIQIDAEPIPVAMLEGSTLSASDMELIAPLIQE
jgi:hypothetical protein